MLSSHVLRRRTRISKLWAFETRFLIQWPPRRSQHHADVQIAEPRTLLCDVTDAHLNLTGPSQYCACTMYAEFAPENEAIRMCYTENCRAVREAALGGSAGEEHQLPVQRAWQIVKL